MANYDDCPLRRDVRRELQRLLCVTGYALKIHSSTLEGLEDDLSALADSAVNRFQRVEARLLLGRYHLTVGNTQAARDHLEFALAQGGETYVGLLADDLLRELEGREPSPERQCDPWPLLAALEAAQACQIPAPARAGLRMLEATALVSLGREEEAEALLDQVPDQEQGDYRMQKLQLRAILCNRRGRTEEAEELSRRAGTMDGGRGFASGAPPASSGGRRMDWRRAFGGTSPAAGLSFLRSVTTCCWAGTAWLWGE